MSNTNDGGPAFPVTTEIQRVESGSEQHFGSFGMSLRDYFAAKAMLADLTISGLEGVDTEAVAAMSYEMADAMLKAREAKL